MRIPIKAQHFPDPPRRMIEAVDQLAERLPREHPELASVPEFQALTPVDLNDQPTLHLDDISEISLTETHGDHVFYQDRARLRAFTGDVVVSCSEPIAGYDDYCRDFLNLGCPEWLRPDHPHHPLRIVESCWQDRAVRERLCDLVRKEQLSFLHPHMGTRAVWELAMLLWDETGVPVQVIAPPPRLSRWVNNKVAFTETVHRLFGSSWLPETRSAFNLAVLAKNVRELVDRCSAIGLKLPDSAGGEGNVVLPAALFRGKSLAGIERQLRSAVNRLDWQADRELLVDVWETNVLNSPSCQIWIPPLQAGPAIVEGLFVQNTAGTSGNFHGAVPARLPADLTSQIVDHCWLLARLFQRLGYIGRCSFDLILIGDDLATARVEFIECNGRWGGTSLPMMLMNRLFGDYTRQAFEIQIIEPVPGLDGLRFTDLLSEFGARLYEARRGDGSLIFYNPGRMSHSSGLSAIVLGEHGEAASHSFNHELRDVAERYAANAARDDERPSE